MKKLFLCIGVMFSSIVFANTGINELPLKLAYKHMGASNPELKREVKNIMGQLYTEAKDISSEKNMNIREKKQRQIILLSNEGIKKVKAYSLEEKKARKHPLQIFSKKFKASLKDSLIVKLERIQAIVSEKRIDTNKLFSEIQFYLEN